MVLAAGAFAAAPPAEAVESPEKAVSERAEARLVADAAVAAPGGRITAALALKLAPHWHSYWRNPGASGLEPKIEWTAPEGVAVGPLQFPTPVRIPFGGLVNFGYNDEAIHLVDIDLPSDWPVGEPVSLTAKTSWLVCKEQCVPEAQTFTLSVPTGPATQIDRDAAAIVARGLGAMPARSEAPARFRMLDGATYRLEVDSPAMGGEGLRSYFFFSDDWRASEPSAEPEVERRTGGVALTVAAVERGFPTPLTGVLRAEDASGAPIAIEVSAIEAPDMAAESAPAATAPAPGPARDLGLGLSAGLGAAALLAFLGGVILNVMPCVFPVLALKAMSIARAAHADAAARGAGEGGGHGLSEGLAYAAGVLASFLAFAGGLIALKAAGVAVGWGFQLQSPIVVALLAYVLVLVGLNLAGVFEISLSFAGAGQNLAEKGGLAGSFFTGVLAALVAAPCTAPFMGAALGFALTQDVATAIAVFAALGLGFAAPIVLLSAAPATARLIPRPGPWMERFRQALAFPMFLAAVWLLWVLGNQAGVDALFAALVGAVLLGFAFWVFGAGYPESAGGRVAAVAAGALALLGAAWALQPAWSNDPTARVVAAQATEGVAAEAYGGARLAELRGQGRPVLLNVTADWCISCKVNEVNVLSGARFEQALSAAQAVYLKADWTSRDEEVTALLAGFGRVGAPLYVVFPGQGGEPIVLPQILTNAVIEEALAS